jgi:hypothetical protein
VGTAVCGSELRKKGAAVEAVGWSDRVCWRKTDCCWPVRETLLRRRRRTGPAAEKKKEMGAPAGMGRRRCWNKA